MASLMQTRESGFAARNSERFDYAGRQAENALNGHPPRSDAAALPIALKQATIRAAKRVTRRPIPSGRRR
jgi:hypothetical protein